VLQLPEGFGLDLAHALAGEAEVPANLLQGARRLAVEAVAGGEDGALAGGKSGEGGAHSGGDLLGLGLGVGTGGSGIGEEVAHGHGLGVAHSQVEGDGAGQGRGEGVHASAGEAGGGGELGGGGGMAEGGVEGVGLAGEAGAVVLDVEGDVSEGDLGGQGAAKGLRHPPGGVGGEAGAAVGVEEVDGAQEAKGAFLHEVVEGEATVFVAPSEGDHKALIGGGEGSAGGAAVAEGVLVEGPDSQGSEDAVTCVVGEDGRQERSNGGDEGVRVEGQEGDEGGEDGGSGGAGRDGGGQLAAQAGGQMTLGQEAGAATGADRGGQGALLVGGEQGVGGGQRGHADSWMVRRLSLERTRLAPRASCLIVSEDDQPSTAWGSLPPSTLMMSSTLRMRPAPAMT